jgi:hypothetical protein
MSNQIPLQMTQHYFLLISKRAHLIASQTPTFIVSFVITNYHFLLTYELFTYFFGVNFD